jgi:D-sedoheptulose 7-phosphate isomerase
MKKLLKKSISNLASLLPKLQKLEKPLQHLADTMLKAFESRGKVLTCGNGGSAADAFHFAEELTVRYHKTRKALPAIALLDPMAITSCSNDFGYDRVFERQIEALGNPGDILVVFTTSGNSKSIIKAVRMGKKQKLITVGFLGKDGGKLKGVCDIELLVNHPNTARIQEAHQLLFHTICEYMDEKVE